MSAYCKVCGDERETEYYPSKRQTLCPSCAADTPRKISREAFDRAYWRGDTTVHPSIRREFYADYLASSYTLAEYIAATTAEY